MSPITVEVRVLFVLLLHYPVDTGADSGLDGSDERFPCEG
jgi:hypothetical protein